MSVHKSTDEQRADKEQLPECKYPYNRVFQTRGGVRIVCGEENGKETFAIYHPSGSFVEYFPDGKMVSMSIGEHKAYNKSGVTITVDENHDVHIRGHSKIQVGGGSHVEVQGDAGIIVGGDVALAGLGNIGMNAEGNLYMGVRGNMSVNVEGDFKTEVKGKTTMLSEGNMTMSTKGALATSSREDTKMNSGGTMVREASGGNYDKGSPIHHNSGGTPGTDNTSAHYSSHSDSSKSVPSVSA